jgi:hypothetical protein
MSPVAILFDLQGTCVDFYTSIIDTCRHLDAGRHPAADWAGLLTDWRRQYAQSIGYGTLEGQAPHGRVHGRCIAMLWARCCRCMV